MISALRLEVQVQGRAAASGGGRPRPPQGATSESVLAEVEREVAISTSAEELVFDPEEFGTSKAVSARQGIDHGPALYCIT